VKTSTVLDVIVHSIENYKSVLDNYPRCFILYHLNILNSNKKKGKNRGSIVDLCFSHPLPSGRDLVVVLPVHEEIVKELREQWKTLWRERIDDKVRAEGIANKDYSKLFVERGTVIFATRDFKPLNFRKILEMHKVVDVGRIIPPSPYVGGWRKFIRTVIASQNRRGRIEQTRQDLDGKKQRQHLKKGGRGWLHF
jgi:hypothetical protein